MKKTLVLALLACVTMVFTSCTKEKELIGTTWTTHTVKSEDISEDDFTGTMNLIMDGTMKFVDATKGTMTMTSSATVTTGGQTYPLPFFDEETETFDFTYTFDGEKGTLTATYEDGETDTIPFTYDKKENTIKISQTDVDEETGETMTFELVFTEVK